MVSTPESDAQLQRLRDLVARSSILSERGFTQATHGLVYLAAEAAVGEPDLEAAQRDVNQALVAFQRSPKVAADLSAVQAALDAYAAAIEAAPPSPNQGP